MRRFSFYPGYARSFLLSWILFFILGSVFSQEKNVTGIITGVDRSPLSGATVSIKGSTIVSLTDSTGSFSIMIKPGDVLMVSYIGYKSIEIKIVDQISLLLSLTASPINLNDIVVIGYTTRRVKEITGSVAIVNPKDLTSIPAGQAEQMLQGRVAGLNIISSGQPGAPSNVRLHGIGNFGDVTPLYIIDGVQGDINSLNPNDIESLQVLKDAGAYAIYGVRGANGVIIVTTRNGKNGRTKFSYDFYVGTTRPLKEGPDLLNPQEMADLTWIAYKNSGQVGSNGNPDVPLYGNGKNPILPDYFIAGRNEGLIEGDPRANPALYNIDFTNGLIYQIVKANKTGTDWFHELFNPALSQNHSVSVSGANERNKYLFSFGYLNQQGTALNTYLKRYTARINTEFSVNKNFRIGENLQLSYRDNPRIASQFNLSVPNEINKSILTNPLIPVYDIKGGWAHLYPGLFDENSVAMRTIAKDNKSNYWEVFGNAFAEIDFLKYFTARTNFGGNLVNYYSYNYYFNTYYPMSNGLPNNSFTESSGYRRSWTWTNTLKFSKIFRKDHHVNVLVGIEAIDNYNREVGGSRSGFFTNDINYRFLSNGNPFTQSNYSLAGASTLNSFFSRFEYGFKEKYFLTGTLRRDGTSFFGPQHRWGWFPSISAAWRISEETFLEKWDWITDFKIRASWGKTGFYGNTDPFNQYTLYGGSVADAYYDIYGISTGFIQQGFRATRIGEPKTGWQEDIVFNAGFESIFWNGKLNITTDWYQKKANGLLFPVSLPDVLGGATPPNTNVGVVQNTGIDVLLGSKGKWSKNWQWDATITFTTYKNKILKLTDLTYFIPSFETGLGFVRNETGHPASSFYGYKIIGLFKDAEEVSKAPVQDAAAPGRFKYLDANGDDTITDADRVFLGNANPKFTAGINIGIYFKDFDFSTFFYGSFGNEVVNDWKIGTDFFAIGDNFAKSKALLYNSWTPQHTNATIPIIENSINFSNSALPPRNSYCIENGSYFRNKSMILGYTIPKARLQRIKIERMRVYIQACNLFTITKYTGFDPELSGQSAAFGIDFANYPNNQKQYLVGLSMNF